MESAAVGINNPADPVRCPLVDLQSFRPFSAMNNFVLVYSSHSSTSTVTTAADFMLAP